MCCREAKRLRDDFFRDAGNHLRRTFRPEWNAFPRRHDVPDRTFDKLTEGYVELRKQKLRSLLLGRHLKGTYFLCRVFCGIYLWILRQESAKIGFISERSCWEYILLLSRHLKERLSLPCILRYICDFFFNTIFVSSHMYPENPEETQVIVGSMNMGYISDTARNRTHNMFRPSGSRYH